MRVDPDDLVGGAMVGASAGLPIRTGEPRGSATDCRVRWPLVIWAFGGGT
jgi:hypothetical protein